MYYANADTFKYKIFKYAGTNPDEVMAQIKRDQKSHAKFTRNISNIDTQVISILLIINSDSSWSVSYAFFKFDF